METIKAWVKENSYYFVDEKGDVDIVALSEEAIHLFELPLDDKKGFQKIVEHILGNVKICA